MINQQPTSSEQMQLRQFQVMESQQVTHPFRGRLSCLTFLCPALDTGTWTTRFAFFCARASSRALSCSIFLLSAPTITYSQRLCHTLESQTSTLYPSLPQNFITNIYDIQHYIHGIEHDTRTHQMGHSRKYLGLF